MPVANIDSEPIIVDRSKLFKLPIELTRTFGDFSIKFQNKKAKQVSRFTLNDLTLLDVTKEYPMNASLFYNNIIGWNHTPLDAYCARAIVGSPQLLEGLESLWEATKSGPAHPLNQLSSISFLGTHFTDGEKSYFLCLKYNFKNHHTKPSFVVYEDEPLWKRHMDYALVFKEDFIKRCLNG